MCIDEGKVKGNQGKEKEGDRRRRMFEWEEERAH